MEGTAGLTAAHTTASRPFFFSDSSDTDTGAKAFPAAGPSFRNVRQRRSLELSSPGRARSNKKQRCLIPRSDYVHEEEAPVQTTSITDLPPDLLVNVFSLLDLKSHRFTLPLVCKQWNQILSKPLGLWNHLDIDFTAEVPCEEEIIPGNHTKAGRKVRESRVLQWLKPRAAAVKSLRLRGTHESRDRQLASCSSQHALHDFTGNGVAKLLLTVSSPLEELVIECCQDILTDITFIAMSRLPNLTVLCLKGICTSLSEQDFCAIAKLHHLQELVLDCEQPPEVEEGAEEIKWGLQSFPEGMLHLTNMTHLTLTCHYGITQLPPGISKLNKLQVLNLDFCTLSKLPASLGQLTELTSLDVEGNLFLGDTYRAEPSLESDPSFAEGLARLQSLRYLNLNSCGLTSVPPVVSNMIALETLDLENNELGGTVQPDGGFCSGLVALTRMQCLNVAQCKLHKLPDVVVGFVALRILDLTNNNLTDSGLPPTLTQLSHLKAIGLKKNCLTRVPPVLGSMRSLQEVYLENNPGLEVDSSLDFLARLPNLRILMMGKAEGTWGAASMHHMAQLAAALNRRHPDRQILRISYPGHEPGGLPDEAYQALL